LLRACRLVTESTACCFDPGIEVTNRRRVQRIFGYLGGNLGLGVLDCLLLLKSESVAVFYCFGEWRSTGNREAEKLLKFGERL